MTLETGFILTILNTSKWVTGKLLQFSSWKNLRMRLRYLTNILKLRSLLIPYRFKRMATEALVNCIIKLWLFFIKNEWTLLSEIVTVTFAGNYSLNYYIPDNSRDTVSIKKTLKSLAQYQNWGPSFNLRIARGGGGGGD